MYTPDETGFGKAITLKCYEISYALVRISKNAARERFSDHLEDLALKLLRAAAERSSRLALETLEAILYVVRLGADTGVLNSANCALVAREAEQLTHAVSEYGRIEDARVFAKEEDFSGVFTELPELDSFFRDKGMRVSYGKSVTSNTDDYSGLDDLGEREDESEMIVDDSQRDAEETRKQASEKKEDRIASYDRGESGQNRQSKILGYIRQTEQCKMKDLQENLPGVSERTIRYDIQSLIEQGLIERVGSSGPATYYQIRQ